MRRVLRSATVVPAVAVMVLLSATTAGASPGWFTCSKAARVEGHLTGAFLDRACSVPDESGEGKWELVAGIGKGKKFKGRGGQAVLHLTIPGSGDFKAECASAKISGEVATPNLMSGVRIAFGKCKSLGSPCKSPGAKKEEILTMPLAGHLGYLADEPGHPKVGVLLAAEAGGAGGVQAEPECEGLYKARIRGALIGQISGDVNVLSKESQLTWAVGPYLGELEPGYTPVTNTPSFEDPEEGSGYLNEESLSSEEALTWEGQLPSGEELLTVVKGEYLMIKA